MKNILVTGGGGFIGSAIIRELLEKDYCVYTIDNLSTGSIENIPPKCIFIQGDVADPNIINRFEDIELEGIIHIAGQSSGEISFEKPVYDLNTNTVSTVLLLQLAKNNGCRKFIYASSMSVYGDVKDNYATEDIPPNPKSFYAVGKVASENYMRIFSQYGIQCTALRFFNVFGKGQNMKNLKQGMASIYLAQAISNRHIIVKGSGDRFRDFVYISDVVDAVLLALNKTEDNLFEIYNVSNRRATKVKDIIEQIQKKLTYPVTYEYIEGTPGDQFGIYGENKKIMNKLGWKPRYTFEEGMKEMIEWAGKEE